MSKTDCDQWTTARLPGGGHFAWDSGGCVGGGEGSILISRKDEYMYQLIEAPDLSLACETAPGKQQNWVLGLSRSRVWAPSGEW
jgi:hypothetical protein